MNEIFLTRSDVGDIEVKEYIRKHFITKDTGRPKYFLGIEVTHSRHEASLSQRKYALNYKLQDIGLLQTNKYSY